MRIGVFPPGHGLRGGIFQYGLAFVDSLGALLADGTVESAVLVHGADTELPVERLRAGGWETALLPDARGRRARVLDPLRARIGHGRVRRAWQRTRTSVAPARASVEPLDPALRDWFHGLELDAIVYPYPTPLGYQLGIPYVMTIHDLQHRLQPEFPDVSANGEFEWREEVFREGARDALLVLTDSETSRQDVVGFYDDAISADRVFVLPSSPPAYLESEVAPIDRDRARGRYGLPSRYLFYPAQFWPHKNHERIVEALALLDPGLDVHVVFSGSSSTTVREETYGRVVARAGDLGLAQRIHHLGYVADEDMGALYAEAVGLLMPTFFGPTNIPVIEAWSLGCPVITSDVHGVPEHVGDAALLVDPRSPTSIADAMARLWTDGELRTELVEKGRRRLGDFTMDDHRRRVAEIVDEIEERLTEGQTA